MVTAMSVYLAQWTALRLIADIAYPEHTSWRYLFLLSHMRSYSSVLAHVLGDSRDIAGYGESQIKYRHRVDLWRLRRSIRQSTGNRPRCKFLLDKILHNYVQSPDRFLRPDQARALIFIRPPEATLQSILTMSRQEANGSLFSDPELACDYYVSRMHQLRKDGLRLGKRALYFDADALLERPVDLLADISRWLQLDAPLADHYQIRPHTGKAGFGDPMPNIRAGRILDASASTIRRDTALPNVLLEEANAAYHRCRMTLLENCSVG